MRNLIRNPGTNEDKGGIRHKSHHPINNSCKSQIYQIEEDVFKVRVMRHVAQFIWLLLNIADYMQIKLNNNILEAVRKMAKPSFEYPVKPKTVYDGAGNSIKVKPDEMEIFICRKNGKGKK